MTNLLPGSLLGKYQIRAVLGKGAMGTVYDGMDPVIERRVAIKTVELPDGADPEAQESLARFKREAQAAGRLNHPNIVGVFDYGETDELAYIVMEFVEGQTLKDLLEHKNERLPLAETLRVMDDILAGLVYSHARGVVHRDIKPANVMITRDNRAKIADFGIARIESSSMTQAGTILGTPAYMSAEQFMGQTVDKRSDIYSTGVLLYQLLTGDRPYDGGLTAIMHKVLNTTPPLPSELSVSVPPWLDPVVARAMARRPEDRFPDAAAFADALRHGGTAALETDLSEATIVAAPIRQPAPALARASPGVQERKSSRLPMVAGGGAAAVLALAVVGWLALAPSEPTVPVQTASMTPPPVPVGPPPVALPDGPPATASAPPTMIPPPVVTSSPSTTASVSIPPTPPVEPVQPTSPPSPPVVVTAPPVPVSPPSSPPQNFATTSSTSAPAPTIPSPAAPPLPPVQVDKSPSAIRSTLAAALPGLQCTLVSSEVSESGVATVTGLVSTGSAEATLRQVTLASEPRSTNWQLATFDGPYCPVLDTLRAIADRPGSGPRRMHMALADGRRALRDNAVIALGTTMPDFAGHLQIDYVQHDGTLVHLTPGAGYPDITYTAGQRSEFGRPRSGFQGWTVGPPFGTDMIVAIASTAPLFAQARPETEPVDAYLRDLRAAADNLRRRGGSLAVDAIVIDTQP
ncbi:serine/threonine-protein kinase [Acidisphaera sp. L21]|uniref:serine/threonine-protein kinase n=1 Tax=Acidisphaera sp. L21 TaxID=1641851 RepID=UPI00131D4DDE|nr:serine/threonine-protein kinase [Acidisphaera sp. L21]